MPNYTEPSIVVFRPDIELKIVHDTTDSHWFRIKQKLVFTQILLHKTIMT